MKAIVITGASSGIGKACALALARSGWTVFAGFRRPADGEALGAESGGGIQPVRLDVTDSSSIAGAVEAVEKGTGGRLYGLINNAGIAIRQPLEFIPLEELRRQLEVNLVGQLAVTQACLPLLRRGQGRIIFISSASGRVASPFLGPYAASKAGLESLANTLRLELRPWRITVSTVVCGSVRTPIWEQASRASWEMFDGLPHEAGERYRQRMETANEFYRKMGESGIPVESAVRVVVSALMARRPLQHYLVGGDAWFYTFASRFMPTGWREWITARAAHYT